MDIGKHNSTSYFKIQINKCDNLHLVSFLKSSHIIIHHVFTATLTARRLKGFNVRLPQKACIHLHVSQGTGYPGYLPMRSMYHKQPII